MARKSALKRVLGAVGLACACLAVPAKTWAITAGTAGYASFYWKWTTSNTAAFDVLTPTVKICWEQTDDAMTLSDADGNTATWTGLNVLRQKMETAVEQTWEKFGKIDIVFGLGLGPSCDVKVALGNYPAPYTNGLGYQIKATADAVKLNWTWLKHNRTGSPNFIWRWAPALNSNGTLAAMDKDTEIRWLTTNFLHEMGHVLGIDHEQDRKNIPGIVGQDAVRQMTPNSLVNVAIGPYDQYTFMNYQRLHGYLPKTDLTCGDVTTIRMLYGTRIAPGDPYDPCRVECTGSSNLAKQSASDPDFEAPNATHGNCTEPLSDPSQLNQPGYQNSQQTLNIPGTPFNESYIDKERDPFAPQTPMPQEAPVGNYCNDVTWIAPPSEPAAPVTVMQGDQLTIQWTANFHEKTYAYPYQSMWVYGVATGTTWDPPGYEIWNTTQTNFTPGPNGHTHYWTVPDKICNDKKCSPDGNYWLLLRWKKMFYDKTNGSVYPVNQCYPVKAVWVSKKRFKDVPKTRVVTPAPRTETFTLTSMMDVKNDGDAGAAALKRGDVFPVRWYQKGTWDKINVAIHLYRDRASAVSGASPTFTYTLGVLSGKEGVNTAMLEIPSGAAIGTAYVGGQTATWETILHGWAKVEVSSKAQTQTTATKVYSQPFRIAAYSAEELEAADNARKTGMIRVRAGKLGPNPPIAAFEMGRNEITWIEYWRVMGNFPSDYARGPGDALGNVTQYDAILYCNKRSQMEGYAPVYTYASLQVDSKGHCIGMTGLQISRGRNGYRLPTANEWHYAYNAGATGVPYFWGTATDHATVDKYAWYEGNLASLGMTGISPVAAKQPNAWGFHDIAGGAGEWAHQPDHFRGGTTGSNVNALMGEFSIGWPLYSPSTYYNGTGFRVARSSPNLGPVFNLLFQ